MKKNHLKRIGIAVAVFLAGILVLDIGLHVVSGRAWVTQKLADKIAQTTGREVRLGKAVFNLRGATVEDFAVSKPGGFAEGEMLHLKQAKIKVSLWHLLHGELHIKALEIAGLALHVVRDEQGKLNTDFPSDEPAAQEDSSQDAPFDIAIKELSVAKMEITYTDKQTNLQAALKNTHITVRDFSWEDPFELTASSAFIYQQPDQDAFEAHLSLHAQAYLAELELSKAYADISSFSVRSDDMRAVLTGRVENWQDPAFDLSLDGQHISSQRLTMLTVKDFPFEFSEFLAQAKGTMHPQEEKLNLTHAAITFPGVELSAKGTAQWTKNEYNMAAQGRVQMDQLKDTFASLKPYALGGHITLKAQSSSQKISGRAEWLSGEMHLPRMGKFSAVQAVLETQEHWDYKNGQGTLDVNGMLNGEPFKTNFSFTQTPQKITADLKASADRLILPPSPAPTQADDTPQTITKPTSNGKSKWPLPPITAKADVRILSLDAPFLRGNDFDLQVDMSDITPWLDEAHGTLKLVVNDGQITDLYQLTNSNAVMKVMFMSLNVVGKVFNSLDVLSVLGGLAGSSKGNEQDEVIKMIPDENGEMVAVKVPAHARKVDGKLAYDKFSTDVQFEHGVATVKEGHFISDMMSFNLSGTTNFKTEKVNMTVHAAPGKHETTGIMPLTLKIGGTVSNPSGNMSVLRSVSAMVRQSVTNNFASRAVKKGVGGFFGLFRKNDETPAEQSVLETSQPAGETQTQETVSSQTSL